MTSQRHCIHDVGCSFSGKTGAELIDTLVGTIGAGRQYLSTALVDRPAVGISVNLLSFPPSLALQYFHDDPPHLRSLLYVRVSNSPAANAPPQE